MSTKPIYLDYAATTPVDPEVVAAMLPILTKVFGNPSSKDHLYGREAMEAVEHAREQVAEIANASPSWVVFTSGGTESNNLAIRGIVNAGDHLVVSAIEHSSIIDTAKRLESGGVRVTYVSPDAEGRVHPEVLAEAIEEDTALVSVMFANNELGTINPIDMISELCRDRGVLLHSDAAQAVGKVPVDASAVDLLTMTGHKIYAPKGVGALIVKQEVPLSPKITGGGAERSRRGGTLNSASIVGFGKACELCQENSHDEAEKLRDKLEQQLMSELSGVTLNGCMEHRLPNITSVRFDNLGPDFAPSAISKVACSAGSACGSGEGIQSHVLHAIGLSSSQAASTIRLSTGRMTTPEEIDIAAAAIISAVQHCR